MFADLVQFETLKSAVKGVAGANISSSTSGTNTNSATTLGEVEASDPNYANSGGLLDNWTQNSYALDCSDYDEGACHNGPYNA